MTWLYVLIGLLWLFGWWYTATAWTRHNGEHEPGSWIFGTVLWPVFLFIALAHKLYDLIEDSMHIAKSKMCDFWEDK